jgi:hypothetical protein
MNPITTGVAAALISGVAMYTVGAKAQQLDSLTQNAALVQASNNQFVPVTSSTARPVAATSVAVTPYRNTRTTAAPRRTVSRRAPVQEREIVQERQIVRDERAVVREDEDHSWGKTAMVIGGSAAGAAGVGGIVGGKKGALIGAAIGGGAASIYEATQRR